MAALDSQIEQSVGLQWSLVVGQWAGEFMTKGKSLQELRQSLINGKSTKSWIIEIRLMHQHCALRRRHCKIVDFVVLLSLLLMNSEAPMLDELRKNEWIKESDEWN